ncbi:unnamed protein product, partial [Mesorhabditis belari]|uniref:C-type lectin domain-containing protein n=1 Tax=Mesorhabditis belari TaxID=2138241 RepID=A0AAF3F6P9_9BILA
MDNLSAMSLKKIAQLEADLEEMKRDKDVEMRQWAANMFEIEANLMEKIAKLEVDLVKGWERNRKLEGKMTETKGKNEDLEAQLSDQNVEGRKGMAKIGELAGKINALESKISGFETQIARERNETKEKDVEMSRWTAKIAQIEAKLEANSVDVNLLTVDGRERNRELERKMAETKRKNDDHEAQLNETQQELVEARAKISGLETEIKCEQKERSDEFTKINSKISQSDDRSTKIDAELKVEIDSKVAEMSRIISMKMAQIETDLMGKIMKLEADVHSFERENKTAEIMKLRADLNGTMTFLDLDLAGWSYLAKTASWYKVIDQKMTFDEVEAYCADQMGHLVCIHSREENDFVRKLAKTVGSYSSFWIGLKRNPNKRDALEWTDGSSMDFINWHRGQPDSDTHAALWNDDGKWRLYPRTYQFGLICKRSSQS